MTDYSSEPRLAILSTPIRPGPRSGKKEVRPPILTTVFALPAVPRLALPLY